MEYFKIDRTHKKDQTGDVTEFFEIFKANDGGRFNCIAHVATIPATTDTLDIKAALRTLWPGCRIIFCCKEA